MSVLQKQIECKHCKVQRWADLTRDITASGVSQIYWQCQTCKCNATGTFIEHEKVTKYGINIDDIPVVMDYRGERCAVCGELGAEYHHWAPRHLFGDADAEKWPGAYLCQKHHTLWHRIVTPLMSMRGKNDRVQDRSIQL